MSYVLFNFTFAVLTSILMLFVLKRHRFLVLKPSVIVTVAFHVVIQWPATVRASEIEHYLPDSFEFALILHAFPLVGFYVSTFMGRRSARALWLRVTHLPLAATSNPLAVGILGLVAFVILGIYLSTVPLSETGLYAIFTEPTRAAHAREESLKLVPNALVRYTYSLLQSVIGPLLAVCIALLTAHRARFIGGPAVILGLVGLGAVIVSISLAGNRNAIVLILLSITIPFFLRHGLPIRPLRLGLAILAVLLFPVILTILREGRALDTALVSEYFGRFVTERIFGAALESGLYHVHYVQNHGFFGVAAIPRLATLFGLEPIYAPNVIGLYYLAGSIRSVSANATYVLSYYAYFGPISLVFSFLGLWSLDLALWVYRRTSKQLLIPVVTVVSISSLSFVSSDYSTSLITHGFLPALVGGLCLDAVTRRRKRPAAITEASDLVLEA